MFTSNYIALRKMQFFGSSVPMKDCQGNTINGNGQQINYGWDIGYSLGRFATSTTMPTTYGSIGSAWHGVRFGSGSTPANKNDYTLEAPILSGLSVEKGVVLSYKDGEGVYIVENSFVVTNTGTEEINIWEAGIYGAVNTSTGSSSCYCVLLDRIVLTEPVTIAPGEQRMITYRVTFNQTLNVE